MDLETIKPHTNILSPNIMCIYANGLLEENELTRAFRKSK
jgi:hypothetical protein